MPRSFIEVSYMGTRYSGFQVQENANSIQAEVEKALNIFYKEPFILTGSSRTDAGVHAISNYFHADHLALLQPSDTYHLNAILPPDIVIKNIFIVQPDSHCRFDAISRNYKYFIYDSKDPFLSDRAYFFPYKLNIEKMQEASELLMRYDDFTSFSKRNTQVNNFICKISESDWKYSGKTLVYNVRGNRFLRGMVRGLVGTMLKVGTGKRSISDFKAIIEQKDCSLADFSIPAHGLFLEVVEFNGSINGLRISS